MSKPLSDYPKLKQLWVSMRARCHTRSNGAYPRYGGRGIRICDDWKDFYKFKQWAESNGYREGLSLDRVDNDGDYSPENCRWATRTEQLRNRTNNRLLTAFGETKCLTQWLEDERCRVNYNTLWKRLRRAWNIETALTQP